MNKSAQTRAHRNNLLKKYSRFAKENNIRLSYKKVKRLDEIALERGTSFKRQLEKSIIQSDKRKIYYISKKFNLAKSDSKEVLLLRKMENIPYNEGMKIIKKNIPFLRKTNWLGMIDNLRNFVEINPGLIVDFPFFNFKGTVIEFLNLSGDLRREFETYILTEDIELDSPETEVFLPIFVMRYDNIEPLAGNVLITLNYDNL